MRIQAIEIKNYKAFLGTHKLKVNGKNLFIYGENGSGKSSLYYALKDFFQSSIENIDLNHLENTFAPADKAGRTAIKVTFRPNSQGKKRNQVYTFDTGNNDTRAAADTSIRDGNKLKSFLTYKHLLGVHHLKKDEEINLFDLLVKGVLKHFKYVLTNGKELGELWAEVEEVISKKTGREYPNNKKTTDANAAIKIFNEAFGELFNPDSPEYILTHAGPILDRFNHNVELLLHYNQVNPSKDYTRLERGKVHLELKYAGKKIKKPHLFLNEARLSAIAISICLGMIKRHVQAIPCKILFLDDIFIGLDIGNRLPLLEILQSDFSNYQIFITTYDKPWFEYARSFLEQTGDWKTLEFYAQSCMDGTEIPIVFDGQDLLTKAEHHLQQCDYKAAAVYSRSAFEELICNYCQKHKKAVVYKANPKKYTTQDFWDVVKNDNLSEQTIASIQTYRSLILNDFCHYNTARHEIKTELRDTIQAVKNLKNELSSL